MRVKAPGSARGQRRGANGVAGSGCRDGGRARPAVASMSAFGCRSLSRRPPVVPRPRCSPQLGQGRGSDAAGRGELSVQSRLRTRGEGWAVGAKGRQLRQPGVVAEGRAGLNGTNLWNSGGFACSCVLSVLWAVYGASEFSLCRCFLVSCRWGAGNDGRDVREPGARQPARGAVVEERVAPEKVKT